MTYKLYWTRNSGALGPHLLLEEAGLPYEIVSIDFRKGENRTPPAWELYDLAKDRFETVNQYDNPEYTAVVSDLKYRLAILRKRIGDDGRDFPETEKVVQAHWEYDEEDRKEAAKAEARKKTERAALRGKITKSKTMLKKKEGIFDVKTRSSLGDRLWLYDIDV